MHVMLSKNELNASQSQFNEAQIFKNQTKPS